MTKSTAPVYKRAMRNPIVEHHDDGGGLDLYVPTDSTALSIARGHLTLAMARDWMVACEPLFARGVVLATFHDWEELTSYDSGARRVLTNWVIAHLRHIRSADFLVTSRIVAMGVSAASLATTIAGLPMVAHRNRGVFESALEAAL